MYWHATGAIEHETHFDRDGRMHGIEREEFEDGRLKYRAQWRHGRQVGWQQQWSEDGVLQVRTRFVRGTGLDAWFSCGLSETRAFVDGHRHGFERWWSDRTHVWCEDHFKRGVEHGISRRWKPGRLERGFPQFWIDGSRVTRRTYARAEDPTLPPIRDRDDDPRRRAPCVIEL